MKRSLGSVTLVYPTPVFVVGTYDENGKPNVAKIYYRMAAKRANGDVRQQALDRINALESRR